MSFKAAPLCVLMFLLFTSCVQIPAASGYPADPDDQSVDLDVVTLPDLSTADPEDLNDGRDPDLRSGPQDMTQGAQEDLWSGRPDDATPGPVRDMSGDHGEPLDMRLNDGRGGL